MLWNGPFSTIKQFTQPYHDLPIPFFSNTSAEGTFLDVPTWIEVNENAVACSVLDLIPGTGMIRFPVDTQTYNLDALAEMTQKFNNLVTEGEEFSHSFVLIEQYSTGGVKAADPSKSAVPWRDHVLLIAPMLLYPALDMSTTPPTLNEHLDEVAWKKGEEIRQSLVDGAAEEGGHFSYVNYAYGGESLEEVYGKENLGKLRDLKKTYDPENKFGFYAPVGIGNANQGKEERERDEL